MFKQWLSHPALIYAVSTALVIAGFVLAYQFVEPAPPSRIVMGTGNEDGAYFYHANQYKRLLAKSGITLDVRPTSGSMENLERLGSDEPDRVDLAFVQGGVRRVDAQTNLLSIGSMYYEPVWVFYRQTGALRYLAELEGKRLAVGAISSGTRPVALRLLESSGVDAATAELRDLGGSAAGDALLAGEVDAAFFIAGPQSALIRRLLDAEDLAVVDFAQAEAYARLYAHVSRQTLPEGVIDLQRNIPPQSIEMIAVTANLVVRADLHPALIDLLLQAAIEVHGDGDLFAAFGEFPSPKHLEFPLSEHAERFYRQGPTLLRRYLPFWVATFIERVVVMVIPLVALMFPLFKVVPPVYQWSVRSKIYRWYKSVKRVESRSQGTTSPDALRELHAELDEIESNANDISVPLAYTDRLYNLRMHINLVRNYIDQKVARVDEQAP